MLIDMRLPQHKHVHIASCATNAMGIRCIVRLATGSEITTRTARHRQSKSQSQIGGHKRQQHGQLATKEAHIVDSTLPGPLRAQLIPSAAERVQYADN